MQELIRGFKEPFLALPYLADRPKLYRYLVAPAVIALVVAALLLWWLSGSVDLLIAETIDWLPNFVATWIGWLLRALLWMVFLALGYVFFLVVVAVLTTPFCELLSEAVEEDLTGASPAAFSFATLIRDLFLGIAHAARRVLLLLASMLGLFLLSLFVPFFGALVAMLLGAWVTARFAAYDCFDTIWARKGTDYDSKIGFLRTHQAYTTGLGLAVGLLALVPILNILALPLGSIGATRAYFGKLEDRS